MQWPKASSQYISHPMWPRRKGCKHTGCGSPICGTSGMGSTPPDTPMVPALPLPKVQVNLRSAGQLDRWALIKYYKQGNRWRPHKGECSFRRYKRSVQLEPLVMELVERCRATVGKPLLPLFTHHDGPAMSHEKHSFLDRWQLRPCTGDPPAAAAAAFSAGAT